MASGDPNPAPDDRLVCPRCDHDLRGERLTWRDACPLRGRCAECALEFAWGDLLSGRLHYPKWSTEGASGPLAGAARAGRQLLITTVRPRRALMQLRLEHGIRPWPLAAGLVLPFGLLSAAVVLIIARGYVENGIPWTRAIAVILTSHPTRSVTVTLPMPESGDAMVATMGGRGFRLVPRDPAWGPMPTVTEDQESGDRELVFPVPRIEVRTAAGRPVVLEAEAGPAIRPAKDGSGLREVWLYLQPVITAARQLTGITTTYPSPWRMLGRRLDDHLVILGGVALPVALAIPVSVVGFVLLPIARRRARVRWAHLLRLTALAVGGGLGLMVLALVLGPLTGVLGPGVQAAVGAVGFTVGRWLGLSPDDSGMMLGLTGAFGLPILLASIWWTWAARHYLRMGRPILVGASVATVSWLGLVALFFFSAAFLFG